MAIMNRNLNLEEVNSDAFMGIPFLNHQTIVQKVIFWGSVGMGICWNLLGTFLFHLNGNIVVILTVLPLGVGVAFGCNYNEDLSLYRYLCLVLFKPAKVLVSKPIEDIEQINMASERMRQEEELRMKQEQKASPEAQRKLLIKLGIGIGVGVLILICVVVTITMTKDDGQHHTIGRSITTSSNEMWA